MMPGAKVNLLIVDDEPSTRTALSEIFTEFGYCLRSAEDGFTALVKIRQEIPDILLSDLNMPGISGFELLSVVRNQFPAIRVIAMSGAFSGTGLPPGVCADAFYEKGSSLGYLLQIVGAVGKAERPPSLQHPSTSMPVWMPSNGHNSSEDAYMSLSCPECLRTFPKDLDQAICPAHEGGCVYCYSFDSLRNHPAGSPASSQAFQRESGTWMLTPQSVPDLNS
ncbi:MAG: response regulator [Silvibacterium sp.]